VSFRHQAAAELPASGFRLFCDYMVGFVDDFFEVLIIPLGRSAYLALIKGPGNSLVF
jgi:hypothetical protein